MNDNNWDNISNVIETATEEFYTNHPELMAEVMALNKKILDGKKKLSVYDQIDRASTSIPLNIAEGNGKYSSKDRCRYFDIARGSALECASCLDVLHLKDLLELSKKDEGKEKLRVIVSMLIGLIKSNSNRSYEEAVKYSSKQK